MLLSTFDKVINRAPLNTPEANEGYTNRDLSRTELAQSVSLGRAFSCQLKGPRKADNFWVTGFAGLDFDYGYTLAQANIDPFIQQHACLIYTTQRHQMEGQDRFRVVFELADPIYEAETYRHLILGLHSKYPKTDPAAKDPARIWFGSTDCQQTILEGLLDRQTMDELIVKGKEIEAQKSAIKKECSYDLPIEEAAKMLTFIEPQPGYEIWRNICFALGNAYGEDAIPIIEAWSPDEKHRGRHLRTLIQRADGRITLGTVIYLALQNGYQPPIEFINKKRTAEQVAYQDIFNRGAEYATIGGNLYYYEHGRYVDLPDALAKKKIAEYFNIYPTGENQNKYATDAKVRSALSFVKSLCEVPGQDINPPGINLNNGFLKPLYSKNGQVEFQLLTHTSERYCTYKAPFDYLPNADSTEFQKLMDDMLPSGYQEILFRLLGASLDVQEVRKRKGRAIRLLMLYGVGSNGKDTIKEWVSMLYGGHGVTTVPLQAFRRADKDRCFDLLPLVYSRLNWSSENAAISIDTCQTLKNFVTGDELSVEEKNKQGFVIKPKAIGIFNINELPHIETMQEAISSRYAIIEFPYVFTINPTRHNEKPVNPRIKGDPEFVQQIILPALLNRIIQGFKDILASGVDYNCMEPLMKTVREENSHLLQFIEDEGLIEAPHSEGITARMIFQRYNAWCIKVGLIEAGNGLGFGRRNDPNAYDKVITSETRIVSRFRKFFPHLESKAHGVRGRVLNVKFNKPSKMDFNTMDIY